MVWIGSDGLTTTTSGKRIRPAIGVASRMKSKLSLANSAGLVAFAGEARNSV
jgi:hypothetical protein